MKIHSSIFLKNIFLSLLFSCLIASFSYGATQIFHDDFSNGFTWTAWDDMSTNGSDYWGIVNDGLTPPNAWCAANSDGGAQLWSHYDNWMQARMQKTISLVGYENCYLQFDYHLDMPDDSDVFIVYVNDNNVFEKDGNPPVNWESGDPGYHKVVDLSSFDDSTITITFAFISDGSENSAPEAGAFVDDIFVYGDPIGQHNQSPTLSDGYVTPTSGTTDTTFSYYVDYYDQDGDEPDTCHVCIDGTNYNMSLSSGSESDGTYCFQTSLAAGSHNYYFYFTDGEGGNARIPASSSLSGPTVSMTTPPDLTIENLTISDSLVVPGQDIEVMFRVNNIGDEAAQACVHQVYWTFIPPTHDITLGTPGTQIISGHNYEDIVTNIEVPSSVIPGHTYAIGVFTDIGNISGEINRANNSSVLKIIKIVDYILEPDIYPPIDRLAIWDPINNEWEAPVSPNSITSGNVHVIVHGWGREKREWVDQQPGLAKAWLEPSFSSFTEIARAIGDSYQPSDDFHILAFSWIDMSATYGSSPKDARASRKCADKSEDILVDALGDVVNVGSMTKLHFIGHSHGARVCLKAAIRLENERHINVDHLTFLESPEIGGGIYDGASNNLDELLPQIDVGRETDQTFIDSYFGVGWHGIYNLHFGQPYCHSDMIDVALYGGHGYPIDWYAEASSDTDEGGIWWSPLKKGDLYKNLGAIYQQTEIDSIYLEPSSDDGLYINCLCTQSIDRNELTTTTLGSEGLVIENEDGVTLTEGSSAYWDALFEVDAKNSAIEFNYHFIDTGDGDELAIWIDGEMRFVIPGIITGTNEQSTIVDISDLDFGEHYLTAALHSYGQVDAEVQVSDFILSSKPDILFVDSDNQNDSDEDGTPEHPFDKIQEGINIAVNEDIVLVKPGTYHENINFNGKNITLTSTDPEDSNIVASTIIDGGGNGSVVTFENGETSDCVLTGFTITGGNSENGGGIYISNAEPTISHCVIKDNTATNAGGGILTEIVEQQPVFVQDFHPITEGMGGFQGTLPNSNGCEFGHDIASLGDLDGDGITDIAVGMPGPSTAGSVYILFLKADGTVKSQQRITNNSGGFPNILPSYSAFGHNLGPAGDLNGDGRMELAVYDTENDASGKVYILFLSYNGTVDSYKIIDENSPGLEGQITTNSNFGMGLATVGDLDHDGVPDLAVGQSGGSGSVWILFMKNDGTVKHSEEIPAPEPTDGDRFGVSVTAIGDIDNDGVTDIAVGAPYDDGLNGSVWIVLLNSNGTKKSYLRKICNGSGGFTGSIDDVQFGTDVESWGDLDGDGIEEIAVGAIADDEGKTYGGAIWLLYLKPDGTVKKQIKFSQAQVNLSSELPCLYLSWSTPLGDINNDGGPDFAVTTPHATVNGYNKGAAWIWFCNAYSSFVNGETDIQNCVIAYNTASSGGGVCGGNGKINNCTIVNNSSGIENFSGNITNSIIWDNTSQLINCSEPTYCCIQNESLINNCIADNPLFVDLANSDYHLLPSSPCIDAGDPASDWSNEPWPNGGRINMGAYGGTSEATRSRDNLAPAGFEIISKSRIGRTTYQYDLALLIQNQNEYDVTNVQAQLVDATEAVTSVVDDAVSFASIAAGQTATSDDTFSITVDRANLIEPGRLTWELIYYEAEGIQTTQMMMISLTGGDLGITGTDGDITSDDKVNLEDFAKLANFWLQNEPSANLAPPDDIIDINDLVELSAHWLEGPN